MLSERPVNRLFLKSVCKMTKRKRQRYALLYLWPVDSPHKELVTQKDFPVVVSSWENARVYNERSIDVTHFSLSDALILAIQLHTLQDMYSVTDLVAYSGSGGPIHWYNIPLIYRDFVFQKKKDVIIYRANCLFSEEIYFVQIAWRCHMTPPETHGSQHILRDDNYKWGPRM